MVSAKLHMQASQEFIPFPGGDHKDTLKRQEGMTTDACKNDTNAVFRFKNLYDRDLGTSL